MIPMIPKFDPEEIYKTIAALEGQPAQDQTWGKGRDVWVPAMANHGLVQLLRELAVRGWEIIPPEEKEEE